LVWLAKSEAIEALRGTARARRASVGAVAAARGEGCRHGRGGGGAGLGAEINERLDVDAALESREGGVAHPGARGVLCDIAEVHVDVCSLIIEIQERQ
jgi:hypothetical protein